MHDESEKHLVKEGKLGKDDKKKKCERKNMRKREITSDTRKNKEEGKWDETEQR